MRALLEEYYPAEENRISYRYFINRMGFWMATGSGKSLVLIKLIEILWRLMRRGEIPSYPVLILTARDDLLDQLHVHVREFNEGRTDFRILLADLRDYPQRLHQLFPIVGEHDLTVFFYRADNLADEQKERIVDFNYENGGCWYVFLDEAHKGDKEESKRQHIYSILSRSAFLFNFSATFTDCRDKATTVYNFNLSEFVKAGWACLITFGRAKIVVRQPKQEPVDPGPVCRAGPGSRRKPGHPWVYPHSLYAAAYFGLTYRDTVALKASRYAVDCVHSSRNLEPEDLEGLLRLEPLLPGDSIPRRG